MNDADLLQREAQAWVVRLDSGRATSEDARAFKLWCEQSRAHANAFVQARAVWQQMRPAARSLAQQQARQAMRPAAPSWPAGRRAFLGGALAASAAYLLWRPPLGWWPSMAELAADYHTATGEQRSVALADGARLQLNTQTRINIVAPATVELLQGEAQMTLDAGRQAILRAGAGEVSGADAAFNVRHTDASEVCVTCLRGRVTVTSGQGQTVLDAGRQLRYGLGGLGAARTVDIAEVSAWRQRQLVFRQAALGQVVDEVNRYRPGKLILGDATLAARQVQASFSLDRLDDVVALIRDVYGASVTRLPGGIVLFGTA